MKFKEKYSFLKGGLLGLIIGIIVISIGIPITNNVRTSILLSKANIINIHELIQSEDEAEKLLNVMNNTGIKMTVLSGAPDETLNYTGNRSFSKYDENNETILKAAKKYPDRFVAFCTINPADEDKVTKLRECINKGAKGLRLYSGHTFFYQADYPLNTKSMDFVYKYVEVEKIPVIFHVNINNYQKEFERVLKRYPDMKVVCPHFCLSSSNLSRLEEMFDAYPNLYTDISFGYQDYLVEGFERISRNPEKYRDFIRKYKDRFFYGTDIVITDSETKNKNWITKVYQSYRNLLEKDTFTLFLNKDPSQVFNGLNLDATTLEQIYQKNYEQLFE